jgi:hypothetical protein
VARRPEHIDPNAVTPLADPWAPEDTLGSREYNWPVDTLGRNFTGSNWSCEVPTPQQYAAPHSHVLVPHGQLSLPPTAHNHIPLVASEISSTRPETILAEGEPTLAQGRVGSSIPRIRPGVPMTTGQASLFDSLFSLGDYPPPLILTTETPESNVVRIPETVQGQRDSDLRTALTGVEPVDTRDDFADESETIFAGLLSNLPLDREVDSNIIPFVAHSCESFVSYPYLPFLICGPNHSHFVDEPFPF